VGGDASAASVKVPQLIFPLVGATAYSDDFGDARGQGAHEGIDILGPKRAPVVAVERGKVKFHTTSARAGCMLYLYGRSGTMYMYVHLNNDRTRRNDNRGGCRNGVAYAPGLAKSQNVQAGQLIGYVGDSGDANGIASHLHFELHPNGGRAVSPFRRLNAARHLLFPRPPSSLRDISLRVGGTVVLTRLNPERIRIRVTRVRLSNGWMIAPARNVTLALPSTAVVRRGTASGPSTAATLADVAAGQQVTAWTNVFTHNLTTAKADPPLLTVRDLLLWNP
jgi:Peptidase family M23